MTSTGPRKTKGSPKMATAKHDCMALADAALYLTPVR